MLCCWSAAAMHDKLLPVQVYQTQQQIERLEKQHAQHQRESGAASSSSQQQHSSGDAQGAAGSSSKGSAEGKSADHSSADAASQVGICHPSRGTVTRSSLLQQCLWVRHLQEISLSHALLS